MNQDDANSVREIELDGNLYQITPPSNLRLLKDIFALSPNTKQWTFEEFVFALEDRIGWFEIMRNPTKITNRKRKIFRKVFRDRSHAVKREIMRFHEIIPNHKIKITKQVPKRLITYIGSRINLRREFIALLVELWVEMGGKLTAESHYKNPIEEVKEQFRKNEYATPAMQFITNILEFYNSNKPHNKKNRDVPRTKILVQSNEGLRWEIRYLLSRSKYKDSKNQTNTI
tara:strand:+ start:1340 stop:2026 length:687 start_codon:yes stop_codon:yes gene_type:complete